MRDTINLIKMKFLDEVFILGAFDGNAFRLKKTGSFQVSRLTIQ